MGLFDELIPDIEHNSKTDEELKHTIHGRKKMAMRWTAGVIAGAATAIGFYNLTPNTWNVDAVASFAVGVGGAIIAHNLVKDIQKNKLKTKKHSILKRVLYGKGEKRGTAADRIFLAIGAAPIVLPLLLNSNRNAALVMIGLSAYVGKRIYNYKMQKKEAGMSK